METSVRSDVPVRAGIGDHEVWKENRHYSWLESYVEWLEGKEEREDYHAFLQRELRHLRG